MADLPKKPPAARAKPRASRAAAGTAGTAVLAAVPEAKPKPEPHRFRVTVPVADEAVVAWMDLQDDRSLSVRMLIRESIERLGYVDVVNRPVVQLPKRGRPAAAGEEEEDGGSTLSGPEQPTEEQQSLRRDYLAKLPAEGEAFRRAAGREQPADGFLDLTGPEKESEPELLGIALEVPSLKQEREQPDSRTGTDPVPVPPIPEPEQSSGGQLDVQDIFKMRG